MKISEFSNKSNVSEQTIRFYIKKGLLIPLHTSYQYSFSEQDLKDLRYIQSCKRMGFSLEETLRILSLHRVASLHGPKEVSYLLNILQRKRNELEKAQEALKDSIQELSRSIEEYQLKISNPVRTSGMPLSFLDLLECPDCHGAFTLSDAVIRNGQVLSGRLSCGCGAVFPNSPRLLPGRQTNRPRPPPGGQGPCNGRFTSCHAAPSCASRGPEWPCASAGSWG